MIRTLFITLALLFVSGVAHAQQKIVIDAGHGGSDPGGTGNGMQEKVIVLDVTKRFQALLDKDTADTGGGGSWTTFLTRADDTFVSLSGRSAYSNSKGADRFMSIHSNAFGDPSANGIETFSLTEGGQGANLRNFVQEEMVAAWGLTNRGNKTANFAVLRETAAPAILHELAFVTNTRDAMKLGSPEERQKAAVAHLRGLQRHYNLAPYVPNGTPVDATGSVTGHVFDVNGPVVGASVTLDGGEALATTTEGEFAFADVAVGRHTIAVTAAGHDAKSVEVTVVAGQAADAQIELVVEGENRGGSGTNANPPTVGGCQVGSSSTGWLALVGLAGLVALRRRKR